MLYLTLYWFFFFYSSFSEPVRFSLWQANNSEHSSSTAVVQKKSHELYIRFKAAIINSTISGSRNSIRYNMLYIIYYFIRQHARLLPRNGFFSNIAFRSPVLQLNAHILWSYIRQNKIIYWQKKNVHIILDRKKINIKFAWHNSPLRLCLLLVKLQFLNSSINCFFKKKCMFINMYSKSN